MANPSQSPFLAHLQSILASTSSAVNDDNALAEVQQLLAGKTAVRTLTDDDVAQELSQLVQNAKRKHPKSANLTNGRSKASDDSDALSWLKAYVQLLSLIYCDLTQNTGSRKRLKITTV